MLEIEYPKLKNLFQFNRNNQFKSHNQRTIVFVCYLTCYNKILKTKGPVVIGN